MESELENIDKRILTRIVKKLDDDEFFNKEIYYDMTDLIDILNDSVKIFGLSGMEYIDVEFLYQFEKINRDIFRKIFNNQTSKEEKFLLIDSLDIPSTQEFNVNYSVYGSASVSYDYSGRFESYSSQYVADQVRYQYNDGILDYWDGELVNGPEIDNYETHDFIVGDIDNRTSRKKRYGESYKIPTLNSLDKRSLLILKEAIDRRLSDL